MTTRRILNAPLLRTLDVVSLVPEYTNLVDEDGAMGLACEFFAIVDTRHAGGGRYEYRVAPVQLSVEAALIRWADARIVYAEDFERRFKSELAA
jgi:hypothetical protein